MFICLYNWTLTWSNTPTVAGWAGWLGWSGFWWATTEWGGWGSGWASGGWNSTAWEDDQASGAGWDWWAWAAWLYIIEKNEVFS
jgi:hypothetical protein